MFKRRKNVKLSDEIIEQIKDLSVHGKISPGDKLGSETELMDAFGVSKFTMREALRVLEAMGIIEIRKGLMGGVFAAQVDMNATINSLRGFLNFEAVSIYDITMVRYMLEPYIVRIAISQLTDDHTKKLQEMMRDSQIVEPLQRRVKGISFHRYLARMTQNALLILIMDFIDNLLEDIKKKISLNEELYHDLDDYHQRMIAHIIKKNVTSAQKVLKQDILATGDVIANAIGCKSFSPEMIQRINTNSSSPRKQSVKRNKVAIV